MPNEKSKLQHPKAIVILILLQLIIDSIYIFIYPTVNPIRATLIGITAFIILCIPILRKWANLPPWIAFLPIYSSALFGALLVQAGILISKSALSGIVHVVILILTYVIIVMIYNKRKK